MAALLNSYTHRNFQICHDDDDDDDKHKEVGCSLTYNESHQPSCIQICTTFSCGFTNQMSMEFSHGIIMQ